MVLRTLEQASGKLYLRYLLMYFTSCSFVFAFSELQCLKLSYFPRRSFGTSQDFIRWLCFRFRFWAWHPTNPCCVAWKQSLTSEDSCSDGHHQFILILDNKAFLIDERLSTLRSKPATIHSSISKEVWMCFPAKGKRYLTLSIIYHSEYIYI